MGLSRQRCEEIKNLVHTVCKNSRMFFRNVKAKEIAEKLGYVLVPYSSMNEDALMLSLKFCPFGYKFTRYDKEYILYNDKLHPIDVELTIFHEIFHILKNHKDASPLAEDEAEYFAEQAFNYCNITVKISSMAALKLALDKAIEKNKVS